MVPAGRRSGKTELFKRKLVKRALRGTGFDDARFFAGAPTRGQAKRIFWDDLKRLVPRRFISGKPREVDMIIPLVNGSEIHVLGLDQPARVEGSPWDGGGLDEYANMKAEAWPNHVRPALSDRLGWCDFLGVPEGRNHYYDLYRHASAEMAELGSSSDWAAFTWKSAEILPAKEIEAARRDLDELTFEQEYQASFVNFVGRAYYPFTEQRHCRRLFQFYSCNAPLIITFDFNVDPGTAAVMQEMLLPDGGVIGTGIIGEVWIPANSNTPAVCRRLVKDWGEHKGLVFCYGDATGGAGGSAKVGGSDWDLVRKELKPTFGDRLKIRVGQSNPRERVRVNSVNSRLLSADGIVRLMVDEHRAPHVVKDFEGVRLLEGGAGELDKKKDPKLTHLTDGIGYYVCEEFPVVPKTAQEIEFRI
ncbi:MAG: terminase large subunit domain-containing protein [Longimicrobiales bacterium]